MRLPGVPAMPAEEDQVRWPPPLVQLRLPAGSDLHCTESRMVVLNSDTCSAKGLECTGSLEELEAEGVPTSALRHAPGDTDPADARS